MDLLSVLLVLLVSAATAACIAVIWLAREAVLAARSMRVLTDDLQERLVPLLDKTDVTVDALNAELLRIDGAITKFEEAGTRFGAASETISEFVSSPAGVVGGVAEKVRRRWRERKHAGTETPARSEDSGYTDATEWAETGDTPLARPGSSEYSDSVPVADESADLIGPPED